MSKISLYDFNDYYKSGREKLKTEKRRQTKKMKIRQIIKQEYRKVKSRWDSLHICPSKTPTIEGWHTVSTMHWVPLLNDACFKR